MIIHKDFQIKTHNLGQSSLMDDLLRLVNLNNINPFLRPLIYLPIDSGAPALDILNYDILLLIITIKGLAVVRE